MVNVGFSWSSLLGITLAVAGAALYFLRSVQPRLARDHDIFFAAVGLLCGGILFFQGWRQDPILQFGQFLLTGSTIFFAVESIRLRNVATEQAKRNTRIVDDERPVSKVYTYVDAELDQIEPEEELPVRPRIRGSEEARSRKSDSYEDEYRRRPSNRSSRSDERYGEEEPPKRRRKNPNSERPTTNRYDEWDSSVDTEEPPTSSPSRSQRRPSDPSKPKRRRPQEDRKPRSSEDYPDKTSEPYVDYQPVDPPDDEEKDNSGNFDY